VNAVLEATTIAALEAHPATRAWTTFRPGGPVPTAVEALKEGGKSAVYRLGGCGPGGAGVIAKRCRAATARVERTVYRDILPRLGLSAPVCYGWSEDSADPDRWLFVEDAGRGEYSPTDEGHRRLAATWLGTLHAAAAGLEPHGLPDRGPAYYLNRLRAGRTAVLANRGNPVLNPDALRVLDGVVRLADRIEERWGEVDRVCGEMPRTLVHGDFVAKNLRVRPGPAGPELLPLDWETAGWGVPSADLSQLACHAAGPHLDTYTAAIRPTWPNLGRAEVRQLAGLGLLFRLLAAVDWSTAGLGTAWVEKPMRQLRLYQADLTELVRTRGWGD
jgi:hypothetical protein